MAEKEQKSVLEEFDEKLAKNDKPAQEAPKDDKPNDDKSKEAPKDDAKADAKEEAKDDAKKSVEEAPEAEKVAKADDDDDSGFADRKDFEEGGELHSVQDEVDTPEGVKAQMDHFEQQLHSIATTLDALATSVASANDHNLEHKSLTPSELAPKLVTAEDFESFVQLTSKSYSMLNDSIEAIHSELKAVKSVEAPEAEEVAKNDADCDEKCDDEAKKDEAKKDDDIEENDDTKKSIEEVPEAEEVAKSTEAPEVAEVEGQEVAKSNVEEVAEDIKIAKKSVPESMKDAEEVEKSDEAPKDEAPEEFTAKSVTPEVQEAFQDKLVKSINNGELLGFQANAYKDLLGKAFYHTLNDDEAVEMQEFLNK